MTMRKKFLLVLTLFCTGLLLTLAPMSGAAINTGAPSYDSMMQAELDKLLDQISGRFEATGNYLERSDFYTALTKGLAEQGAIKQYYDLALAAQQLADQNKDNPELQEKARIAMDDLFLAVLNQIMLNKGLATTDQEITQALIDILEGRGEGFTEEGTPFVLDPIGSREGAPVIPPDPDVDPVDPDDVTPSFNFLFYGKAYDLEKDIDPSKSTNGILYFSNDPFKVTITLPPEIFEDNEENEEEPEAFISENGGSPLDSLIGDYDGPLPSVTTNYPAAVIPFLFHALPDVNDYMGDGFDLKGYLEALAGEDFILTFVRDGQVFSSTDYENLEAFVEDLSDGRPFESVAIEYIPQKIFESPDKTVNGIVKNKDFYRYTWNTLHESVMEDGESRDFPPYSATLYKNNWISYSYSDFSKLFGSNSEKYYKQIEESGPEMPWHLIFTGLTPGDGGSAGHPGAGLPRGLVARLGEMYGFLNNSFGKPLNLSRETGNSFFDTQDSTFDYLIQLGGEAPANLSDYIKIVAEDGWQIIFNGPSPEEPGQEPGKGEAYLTIGEAFIYLGEYTQDQIREMSYDEDEEYQDGLGFDLSEHFVVFVPDQSEGFSQPDQGIGNQYTVHTGNPFMIADRSQYHYSQSYSSLDEAIVHIADNPGTLDNDFRPGYYYDSDSDEAAGWAGLDRWADGRSDNYENSYPDENEENTKGQYMYGLQTVGSRYYDYYYDYYGYEGYSGYGGYGGYENARQWTPMFTQAKLDESNFLAYVVQVEEDRVNEKILEMTGRNDWKGTINGIRDYKNIRDRDAFFAQNADAQAGRVMRDIHGNWVRVQQYILRPDASTVKVLNVSLREAGGDLSGMSTIDFTTQFMSDIPGELSLRSLPWGSYLSTRYDEGNNKYIHQHSPFINDETEIQVDNMYVKFTNPGNESVQESRSFFAKADGDYCYQYVKAETLALVNNVNAPITYTNTFFSDRSAPSYGYISHFGMRDESDPQYGQGPGYYASNNAFLDEGDTKILDVNIHAVQDDYSDYSSFSEVSNDYGQYEFEAYKGFSFDIWGVLATNEGEFNNLTLPHWDGSIEIIMNRSDFFKKPIDTIYIPMSHMLWSGSNDYYPPPS